MSSEFLNTMSQSLSWLDLIVALGNPVGTTFSEGSVFCYGTTTAIKVN